MLPLAGMVAVVTGASSGIGEATAQTLADHGASVVIAARRADRLAQVAKELPTDALPVETDVSSRSDVDRLFERAVERFERVDIVVNSAGVLFPGALERGRVDEWEKMIDVNLKGVLYVIAAALPIMRAQDSGHIVNIGSRSGQRVRSGGGVYSGTKFAVRAVSEALRQELSKSSTVRVSQVSPGIVDTEFTDHGTDPDFRAAVEQRSLTPLRSQDVADGVLYAVTRPPHATAHEISLLPTEQED